MAAAAAAPVWAYVSTPGASCGLCFGRDRAGRAVLLSSHLRASLSEEVAACEVGAAAQSLRRAEGVNTILPRRPNSGSAINKCPKDTRDSEKMDLFGFDVAEFNALLDGIKCRRSDSLEHRLLGDKEGDRANRMVLTRFDAAEINALFDDIKSRSLDSLERRLFVLLGDKPTDGLDTFAFPEDSVVPTRPPVVASFSKAGREHRRPKVNQDRVLHASLKTSGLDVWAVFDGHGPEGEKVARWLAQNIPKSLDSTLDGDSSAVGGFVTDAVPAVFEILDADLSDDLGVDLATMSGATATIALHKGGKLLVAGVGDTRAILGGPEKDKIQIMTAKHNPADPVEKSRIQRMGGEVKVFPDEPPIAETGQGRVFARGDWSPGLAVARAFGDLSAKVVGVVVTPDIRTADTAAAVDEGGNGQVLIIASDGVWDVIDDATAMQLCLTYAARKDAKAAAQTLVDTAREVWEAVVEDSSVAIDDISAVVAFL